jgi:hypothetical protein
LDYAQARYYSSTHGRFTSPDDFFNDTHASDPQSWNLYVYVRNNPLIFVDPTGMKMTDFINLDSGERTHIEDGKDQVLAGSTSTINQFQETFNNSKLEYYWKLDFYEQTGFNLRMTTAQFNDLAGVIYAEASNSAPWTEAAAIHGVLRNRAAGDGNSVLDQANDRNQVFGANEKDKIWDKNASTAKRLAVFQGIAQSIVTGKDFSNGAYFWHGVDFKGPTAGSKAHERFYLTGFKFTSRSHDIWGLGDHKSGKKYEYKYQSTAAYGKTTFMKLTDAWMKANGARRWNGQ